MSDEEVDVAVVGGGAAGVAAAVGAADAGAGRVLLLERYGFLGGMATAAEVGTLCGLHLRQGAPAWAVGGFPRAIGEAVAASQGPPVGWKDGLWFLPYRPPALAALLDDVLAARGLTPWLHATVTAVDGPAGDRRLSVLHWDRVRSVRARQLVDTSGVAAVATLCGETVDDDAEPQAPALVFVVEGAPAGDPFARGLFLRKEAARAVATGAVPAEARALSEVPVPAGSALLRFKLGLLGAGAEGPADVVRLERHARARVAEIGAWMRTLPGWDAARVVHVAPQLGLRTGRRVVTRAALRREVVLGGVWSDDAVAVGAWPVERWTGRGPPEMAFGPESATYGVPVGCLRAARAPDLWLGGRCIGGDEDAIASARVIGTCLGTGYAAGWMAASSALGRPLAQEVARLRVAQLPPEVVQWPEVVP